MLSGNKTEPHLHQNSNRSSKSKQHIPDLHRNRLPSPTSVPPISITASLPRPRSWPYFLLPPECPRPHCAISRIGGSQHGCVRSGDGRRWHGNARWWAGDLRAWAALSLNFYCDLIGSTSLAGGSAALTPEVKLAVTYPWTYGLLLNTLMVWKNLWAISTFQFVVYLFAVFVWDLVFVRCISILVYMRPCKG
jgi:hypothetical protein